MNHRAIRALVFVFGAAVASNYLSAQAIKNIIVTRTQSIIQTNSSTTTGASATPFSFQAGTEGDGSATDTSPITAAKFTYPSLAEQALSPPSATGNGKWQYTSAGYTDANSLTLDFADGSYGLDLTGLGQTSANLTSIAASHLNTPMLTLTSSGGGWSGGVFNFVVGQDIVVDFGQISDGLLGESGTYHYDFSLNGANTIHDDIHEPNDLVSAAGTPGQLTISTASFLPGTYSIEVGYADVQSMSNDAFGNGSNYTVAGLYEIRNTITLQAIPEPSTYAAILGALALVGVMLRRRRRCPA